MSTFFSTTKLVRLALLNNAPSCISVTELGKVLNNPVKSAPKLSATFICVIFASFAKTYSSMVFNTVFPVSNTTVSKLVQFVNAYSFIVATVLGINISNKPAAPSKACSKISVSLVLSLFII